MPTVKTILNQMTDSQYIMQELKKTIRSLDPMFQEEEAVFLHAVDCFTQEMEEPGCFSITKYLTAKENELAMELIYIGWQGFQLNLEIFKNPVAAMFLQEDYEELHLERRLCTLPTVQKARADQSVFCTALEMLPEEKKNLVQSIDAYYSYLQTVGYKLAHYFGFRLADQFLPNVVPGYASDPVHSSRYAMPLSHYLQADLAKLE